MMRQTGLLVLLILLVCGNTVLAEPDTLGAGETARQLLSPGWEEFVPPEDEAVIVYGLHLIELTSTMGEVLEASVELSVDSESAGGYVVITEQTVLSRVGEYPSSFTGNLGGLWESYGVRSAYDAWLLTMGEEPVSIELTENAPIGTDEGIAVDQELAITLTPRQIHPLEPSILTDVEVDYLSPAGTFGKARSTAYIGPVMCQPLALVVQEVQMGGQRSKRHFALYVTATALAPTSLPERGPLVSIGSIKGLQGLFGIPRPGAKWTKLTIGLAQSQERFGLNAGLELEKTEYRVNASLEGIGSAYGYRLGADLRLYQELGLSAHMDGRPGMAPVFRVGLSDQVHWDNAVLEATYLPVAFADDTMGCLDSPWIHFDASIGLAEWSLRYEFTYDAGQAVHGIGVMRQLSSNMGLSLMTNRMSAGENQYCVGLVWRMN